MDIGDTIAPTSDQLDAVDLLAGPRTFTVTKVTKNDGDQPVNISLAEFDRVWRPGKSMRRVLVACWGSDASTYVGRRVTLYCDPAVQFGGEKVGGTRISHLSHIDRARTVPLLVTRGRSAMYRVEPLVESAPAPSPEVSLALRIDEAVAAFGRGDVTEQQLVQRIRRPREQWTPADVDDLQRLYDQLKAREITKAEAFPDDQPADILGQLPPEDEDPTVRTGFGEDA